MPTTEGRLWYEGAGGEGVNRNREHVEIVAS